MSQEGIVDVITKALVDAEFRSQLLAEPEIALSGYDLTEEAAASLSTIEEDAFDEFVSEIEERVSKATPINMPRVLDGVAMEPEQMEQVQGAIREVVGSQSTGAFWVTTFVGMDSG
jgi:hypothetical protein